MTNEEVIELDWIIGDVLRKNKKDVPFEFEDLCQEIRRHWFDKSIPKFNPDKGIKFTTYIHTCTRNHLINIIKKQVRKHKLFLEIIKNCKLEVKEQVLNYYCYNNKKDTDMMGVIIQELNLSSEEKTILRMTLEECKLTLIAETLGLSYVKVTYIKKKLFKRLSRAFNLRENW